MISIFCHTTNFLSSALPSNMSEGLISKLTCLMIKPSDKFYLFSSLNSLEVIVRSLILSWPRVFFVLISFYIRRSFLESLIYRWKFIGNGLITSDCNKRSLSRWHPKCSLLSCQNQRAQELFHRAKLIEKVSIASYIIKSKHSRWD